MGCQTGCTATVCSTMLNEQPLFVQPVVKPSCTTGLTTDCIHDTAGLTTGWIFVYTIQMVIIPVWQQVASCKRGLTFAIKVHCDGAGARRPFKRPQLLKPGCQRWRVCPFFVDVDSLSDRLAVKYNVWRRPWKRTFNCITDQTSIQHLQTFSIKDSLQCTDIDLMTYRNGTSHVPKSYYKKHMYRNWSHMYQSRHVPKLSTSMYRKQPNPHKQQSYKATLH